MNQPNADTDPGFFSPDELIALFHDLQRYVGWCEEDPQHLVQAGKVIQPYIADLVDDFYRQLQQHENAAKVITGGQTQIDRLKLTLQEWIRQLFSGKYDDEFIKRRWRVGWRHVLIGLDQVYYIAAMSRLRSGIVAKLVDHLRGEEQLLSRVLLSTNRVLDLDLAIINHAYSVEYMRRQEQSQRLANIGQVAGGVAHELRNPLNVVKTSVYYLLNARSASPEKVAEHLERIHRQVNVCDRTIGAISDFARLKKPITNRFDLRLLIAKVLDAESMPEHCTQELIGTESAFIEADERQLEIVFGNLIRNAYEAMVDGGKLTVELGKEGEKLFVKIEDEGVGIPPELQKRITEPLFSTKTRGIGLGLSMVKSILEKHQAELNVISELGSGTTIKVNFATDE